MTKESLNLPKTSFSMKADLSQKEPDIVNFWDKIDLYKKTLNVYFCNFIRKDKKFKSKISLISQMKKDLIKAKFDLEKKIIL